jgi:hypothetical protein
VKLITREHIDVERWNQTIEASGKENIFCYSWYLDAVAENWNAIVSDDYSSLIPVPFTSKLGVKQMYQAPFTREYDLFGETFDWQEVLSLLQKDFKAIEFRNGGDNFPEKGTERIHQWLELKDDFQSGYRSNARRILKKAKALFSVESGSDVSLLIDLFKRTTAHKIDSIKEADLIKLTHLMKTAIELGKGEMWIVKEENQLVAAGFFLKDKKRITYLKGASEEEAKRNGSMYVLMDFAFNHYCQNHSTFDFGGSDVENVANFYKKFGAVDRTYYNYRIDNLPFWFKTIKKIKRS